MEERVIRLQSLELNHIKNVNNGKIEMPNCFRKKLSYDDPEILGLYGQNGSGKTAVIDVLYYLQRIMVGESMKQEMADYIDAREEEAEISAEFAIYMKETVYEVGYKVILCRASENRVEIRKESLSSAKNTSGGRSNKITFMEYNRADETVAFTPKKRFDDLVEENKGYRMDLLVARKVAEKSNCSYIFGEGAREIFFYDFKKSFQEYGFIIKALYHFAAVDLFVIRNSHSGMISANLILPMAFRIDQDGKGGNGLKGDFAVSLKEPTLIDKERRDVLYRITEEINTVLSTIIPGMRLDIRDYGAQLLDNGKEGIKIELLSVRDGVPIPIRMESEGIIKIISILNALIQAFANHSICLAIDELDSGIFEYMLGELLDIFSRNAKGQLIFTSHNLRALEMLHKESIMFSTANPKNRYIHMKNIKNSNNLRDVYLRSITLGGQNEEIYAETDSLKIARAFRKAGRSVRNEKQ
ncbi:AAA family ATPase [Lachnospiraceae bacterium 54-53]